MPKEKLLTQSEKDEIAHQYSVKGITQTDLAKEYSVSATTIRRALYEYGLCKFDSEVTPNERDLLEVLKQYTINTAEQLRSVLAKGVQCQ